VSVSKKIALGLTVVVLVGVALYEIAVPPLKFEVKSIAVVDYDGYPAVKIDFETNRYPVMFKLSLLGGGEIDTRAVSKSEKVIYLYLGDKNTNIIGPKTYTVNVFYSGNLIWSKNIVVEGVKPHLTAFRISTDSSLPNAFVIKGGVIEIENLGDTPLYLTPANVKFRCNGDVLETNFKPEVVLPNEQKVIEFETSIYGYIWSEDLDEEHWTSVSISEGTPVESTGYVVVYSLTGGSSFIVSLTFQNLHYEAIGWTTYLSSLDIRIHNYWLWKFNPEWIKIIIDGIDYTKNCKWESYTTDLVNPGEEAVFRLYLPPLIARPGSVVSLYIGGSAIGRLGVH